MRHDPARLAHFLRETATLYEHHAREALEWLALDWTQGRAASLEARVSGSGHSDPVSAAALAELDRLEREAAANSRPGPEGMPMHPKSILHRWTIAVSVIGLPVPMQLRWYAAARTGSTGNGFSVTGPRVDDQDDRFYQSARTLTDIIHLCRPITREVADKILGDEKRAVFDSGYCQACESPTGPTPDGTDITLKAGLCHPGCYGLELKHIQRGRWIDRPTFISTTQAGVTRGEIHRPASPLYRTAVPVLHEGDVA